jgi:hypothetical protein
LSPHKTTSADYSGLIILAVLAVVEVAILYAVIALDTALTPLVHRLLQNAAGVFTLVICVVLILILGMIIFLSWIEWLHKRRVDS